MIIWLSTDEDVTPALDFDDPVVEYQKLPEFKN